MFRGINAINLDAKGRIVMPTRYRASLSQKDNGQLIVTINTEADCLLLYPLSSWKVIEAKIESLPSFNPTTRRIQRLLIGHATEVEMDGNGRILLPPLLREYATLDKKAMLLGQGKKFEIWDEKLWHTNRDKWLKEEINLDQDLPDDMKSLSL